MARRLKTHEDARRYVASLINRVEKGELDPQVSGRLGFLANVLLKAISDGELASRLEKLEETLNAIRNKNPKT